MQNTKGNELQPLDEGKNAPALAFINFINKHRELIREHFFHERMPITFSRRCSIIAVYYQLNKNI